MFKLNFKIVLRNIWRNKLTTSIKLIGLVVGLSTVVVLVAYVRYELSYDESYPHAKEIYRVQAVNSATGQESINLPSGLTAMLMGEMPHIVQETQMDQKEERLKVGNKFFTEQVLYTENSFFKMFGVSFILGNERGALNDANSAVISESFAKKAFPNRNVINQTIKLVGEPDPVLIVGIVKDLPKASHFQANIFKKAAEKAKLNWRGYRSIPQYFQVHVGADMSDFTEKIKPLYKKYDFPSEIKIKIVPITKIHLHSHTADEQSANSDIKYIYIFSTVALLILVIAIFNFINLTIAASLKRGKEIGVKKVMGASRANLRFQFLTESYLYFVISIVLVMMLAYDFVPLLGDKLGINISLRDMLDVKTIGISLVIIVLSGFAAGLYPAIVLSRLMPVKTLKGNVTQVHGRNSFKRFLLVFQFSVSAFLIVCTLVINSQLEYIRNKDLGFNTDQILVSSYNSFKNGDGNFKKEVIKIPGVESVSMATFSPGMYYGSKSSWVNDNDTTYYTMDFIFADLNFMNTLGIQLVKGRSFSRDYGSDIRNNADKMQSLSAEERRRLMFSTPILLNESAVKLLNLNNPIDTLLIADGLQGKVIGVVKNFNGMSLHNMVKPLAIKCEPDINFGYIYVKISGNNVAKVKADIEGLWKKNLPDQAPTFQFVDQQIQQRYTSEIRLGSTFTLFCGVAIFLCVMGLFGMVYFDLEQRTKEIAVRKILGATFKDLLTMLNGTFIKIVLIANVIIWPVAYYLSNEWLASFYYRTEVSYLPYVVAILACLVITILTVSAQAIKIVRKSPVDALKYE